MAAKGTEWRPGPSVCRCCFAEGCYKDISTEYFWMGKREVYSEMLTTTFDINIAYSQSGGPNSNSRLICEPCISRLRDAADFKRQVQECERVFLQHLDPVASRELEVTVQITPESPEKEVKLERVKVERKLSDDDFEPTSFPDDDDDDDDMDDEPLTKLASKVPKKESVDLMDLLDNAKAEKRKSTTKVKATPAKKVKKKEAPKPSASNAPPKTEKKKKGITQQSVMKKNAEIILKNTTAYPFRLKGSLRLLCVFCLKEYQEPREYRRHIDHMHQKFSMKTVLELLRGGTIRYIKVDCTDLRCRLCLQAFDSLEEVAHHLNENHNCDIDFDHELGLIPFKLESNNWVCCICKKKHSTIMQLSKHMFSHYFKHGCEQCGRTYLTIQNLNLHLKLGHGQIRCRKCFKEFSSLEQKREHCRKSVACQQYMCTKCGERFLSYDAKEKHKQEVHGIPVPTYKCIDCDLMFGSRKKLYIHYRKLHSEDSIICPYCGQRFADQNSYLDHKIVHTKERNFQCEVCSKTFSRAKSLKQHSWTHSEVKRFNCVVCDQKFNQKCSLECHMLTQHPGVEVLF